MRKYTKAFSILVTALLMLSMLAVFPVKAHEGWATIYLSPALKHITAPPYSEGDKFSVEVRIKDYFRVASYQVQLVYDKSLLNISDTPPPHGDVHYAPDHVFPGGTYAEMPTSVGDYNTTHQYYMKTAATYGAQEYNGTDAGIHKIDFTIMKVYPGKNFTCALWLEPEGTYTCDTHVDDNAETLIDGVYELECLPSMPHLKLSPPSVTKPDIDGDRIVGTDRAKFSMDIQIRDIVSAYDIILVEFQVRFDPEILKVNNILEGTFMNNTAWAPYGTLFAWVYDPEFPEIVSGFVLINTNDTTGEWDWPQRPGGSGLLALLQFEAIKQPPKPDNYSCPVNLEGVFGEFFINTTIEYVPYGDPENATYTIFGYNWALPVAAFTWTPPTPLPGAQITFDASASYGYKNVMGVLTPDPTVIVEYEWDFGDANVTATTDPIITHVYATTGDYLVSLKVTDYNDMEDTEKKIISVVYGRLLDVFTQYGPPYGGQGINMTSDMFWPQKPVILTAILTYNGDPVQYKPVVFQILSPTGVWNFTRVVFTDEDGVATVWFGLPWPCDNPESVVFGIWTVIAKADIQCVTCEDWLWFKVWWLSEILSVTPKKSAYHKCETAEFVINLKTYATQTYSVLITLVVYDDLNVPIGQASTWITIGGQHAWCTFLNYNTTLSVHIPKYAFVGQGKVYVNALKDWPWNCGYALSPERSATFSILKPL